MEKLKLNLSTIGGKKFRIHADKYGTEESELPFSDGNEDPNLFTVLNALNTFDSEYKHREKDDEDWMVTEGILTEDKCHFHSDIQKNIGRKLYEALFLNNIRDTLNQKFGKAGEENLHIQIQYDADAILESRLSLYPWQLVHNGEYFLAKSRAIFSYLIAHGGSLAKGKRKVNQIKVLLISPSVADGDNEKLQSKELLIRNGLKKAEEKGLACLLNWCESSQEKPTYKQLCAYLTDNINDKEKLPDIIHFDGHGVFKKECGNPSCPEYGTNQSFYPTNQEICTACQAPLNKPKGFLLFENDEGKPDYIDAEQFAELVTIGKPKPALVVITACKSALAHRSESVFNGIAQSVLRKVPAVVATPFNISVKSTANFVEQFYRALGAQQSLLEAVKSASKEMDYYDVEWYRPVIFLRDDADEDGYLFEQDLKPDSKESSREESKDWVEQDLKLDFGQSSKKEIKQERKYLNELSKSNQKWIDSLESSLKYKKELDQFDLKLRKLPEEVQLADGERSVDESQKPSSKQILKKHEPLKLLILGSPGSGKTTIILTLLKDLNELYNKNKQTRVPVYLHLSSWTNQHENFTDWLVDILYTQEQIPKKISKKLDHEKLILLLDGLDEVNPKYQQDCLKKLNCFIQNHSFIRIVVCCRYKAYQSISSNESEKLKLKKAYKIEPLRDEEIREYLIDQGQERDSQAINILIRLLRKFPEARTPLVIYVIKVANIDTTSLPTDSPSKILSYLWKKYIEEMLGRGKREAKKTYPEFTEDDCQTQKWLSFLAKQLSKNDKIFKIERIQSSWLFSDEKKRYKNPYFLIFCLTTYMILGLIIGLTAGLYFIYFTDISSQFENIIMTKALALKLITIGLIAGVKIGLVTGIASCLGVNKWTNKVGTNIAKKVRKRLKHLSFLQKQKKILPSKEIFTIVIQRFIKGSVPGIIFALFLLLSFNFSNQQQLSNYYSAIYLSCIFGGMIFSLIGDEIRIAEIGTISFQKVLIWSLIVTGLGIPYVLCRLLLLDGVYSATNNWYAVYEVIIFTIVGAIYGGAIIKSDEKPKETSQKEEPDNGIISLRNSAILYFICILFAGILVSYCIDSASITNAICLGLVVGILAGLGANEGAGIVCIQHFILRVLLYWKGSIPWKYNHFLNYAYDRILLRKVGNSYFFISDKLLEHFSNYQSRSDECNNCN